MMPYPSNFNQVQPPTPGNVPTTAPALTGAMGSLQTPPGGFPTALPSNFNQVQPPTPMQTPTAPALTGNMGSLQGLPNYALYPQTGYPPSQRPTFQGPLSAQSSLVR